MRNKTANSSSNNKEILVANVLEEGRFGGPQARVSLYALFLKEFSVRTHVVLPSHDSEKFQALLDEYDVEGIPLKLHRLQKQPKALMRYLLHFIPDIYRLYRLFKRGGYDIVHVNGSYQIKGALAAWLARKPLIWHVNDSRTTSAVKAVFTVLAGICADAIAYVSAPVYEYYLRGTSLERIPSIQLHAPVDPEVYTPAKIEASGVLGGGDSTKILMVSNINPTKGIEYLIEASRILNERHDGLEFYVAGPVYKSQGGYFKRLERYLQDIGVRNFRFLGQVDNIAAALKEADIFAFSSTAESGPIVVWEAMAMEMPVVTTDVGMVSDVIVDGVSGFIVPVRDAAALVERISLLINDRSLAERMGREARLAVMDKVSARAGARAHRKIYDQVLGAHRGDIAS